MRHVLNPTFLKLFDMEVAVGRNLVSLLKTFLLFVGSLPAVQGFAGDGGVFKGWVLGWRYVQILGPREGWIHGLRDQSDGICDGDFCGPLPGAASE